MITFERTIPARPEHVFDAFITPEDLLQWHRASEDWTTPHAETDPRVGGRFTISFGDPTGEHSFDFTGNPRTPAEHGRFHSSLTVPTIQL